MPEIFASAPWYRRRSEPEKNWRGVLRERDVPRGPAVRPALSFQLLVEDGPPLPVYAANVQHLLAPFTEQEVLIRGKLVDLSEEGFGPELWISTIDAASNQTIT